MADDPRTLRRDLARLQQACRELADSAARQADQLAGLRQYASQTERFAADLSPLVIGITSLAANWPTPFPDTAYGVQISLIVPAANLGQVFGTFGAKTTAGCTVVVRNTSGGAISAGIDVLAVRT